MDDRIDGDVYAAEASGVVEVHGDEIPRSVPPGPSVVAVLPLSGIKRPDDEDLGELEHPPLPEDG